MELKVQNLQDKIEELNFDLEQSQQSLTLNQKQSEMQKHQFEQEKTKLESKLEQEIAAQLEALESVQSLENEIKAKIDENLVL